MINFVSLNNKYIFESVDILNKSICLKVNEDYITFNWKGDVEEFYNDTDDLFGNITSYRHNIELGNFESSANDDVGYIGDFIIEHIIQCLYNCRYF